MGRPPHHHPHHPRMQDWRKIPCDILAPCSTSGFIDTHVAAMLKTRIIVGSSNAPFKDVAAQVRGSGGAQCEGRGAQAS